MLVLVLAMLTGPERAMAQRAVGIDVSDYQSSSINWGTLKSTYGISFGWAKCSEGTGTGSGYGGGNFTTYEANAKAAGVLIGAYHYARYDLNTGTAGATAEANAFWSIAGPYIKGGGYYIMPMLDVEASFTGYTATTLSQWVNQWCITVSNTAYAAGVPGIKPCIYCSSSHAASYLNSTVTQWNTDIADWAWAPGDHAGALAGAQASASPPAGISPWTPSSNWQFWQYDDQNAAQAITTGDGDIYNGTLAQLTASKMVIGGAPPGITTQPASQIVLAGANVPFNVGASGATPLSYQWRFNGGNISGATASSYTKSNVQAANAGSYSVIVTNAYGSANSANAVLTVHTPPTITAQPANTVTGFGLNVNLSATATGDATLSYQWRHNGTNLASATTSILTIIHAQATNAGTYAIVVTNLYGTATSANALLSVLDPYILNQPQSQTVTAGAPATFIVGTVGTAPLSYIWSKDGVALTDGTNLSGSRTPTLSLASVQAGDVGMYSVTVSNVNGSMASSNAALISAFAPLIVTQPACQKVLAGSTVVLSVSVVGSGPITNQWQKDGTNLVDAGKFSGTATTSLVVSNVQIGECGNYSLVASNAYGSAISSNALLSLWPVVGWGSDVYGQADVPAGLSNVVAIAAGDFHSLALKGDGTVMAWGAGQTNTGVNPQYGQSIIPSGLSNVASVARGYFHSLALEANGTIVAWGAGTTNAGVSPNFGQAIVPAALSNVVAIAGGAYHSLALEANGTVVAWGAGTTNPGLSPNFGQAIVPSGLSNVVAIATGLYHSLALEANGTVVAWGAGTINSGITPNFGQAIVPTALSNVVAISAGIYHSLALKADGTVVIWGAGTTNTGTTPNLGQAVVPAGVTNVIALAGGGFHTLVLEGNGSPTLTTQPLSQTAAAGATVSYAAMVVGSQPLSYQWQVNGSNIAGATAAVLSLANVQLDDAGAYSVTVTNAAGAVTSSNGLLTVLSPPVISAQPTDAAVVVGTSATFTVGAAGSAPLGYQWQFNSAAIAGATQSAYNLASVQLTNAGTYSAVVSNAYGVAISSNAVLTVLTPPTITTQPSNQTVVAGASAGFVVQAASAAPLNYQWYFGQTNLLAGANGAALNLDNVQPAQAGGYSVVVNNVAGSVTSVVATLTVLVPSPILSAPTYGADGVFQFNVGGLAGSNYVIASSTNLTDWLPLETNTSPFTFTDTNAVNVPLQFYRAQPSP